MVHYELQFGTVERERFQQFMDNLSVVGEEIECIIITRNAQFIEIVVILQPWSETPSTILSNAHRYRTGIQYSETLKRKLNE